MSPRAPRPAPTSAPAAWNAAPIVGRLVARIGPQLGVYPDANREVDLADVKSLIRGGGE